MQKLNLVFPIEVMNREIDFRVLLACLCARDDTTVWVGQSRVIYALANSIRGGMYVGKNIFGLPPNITWHRYQNLKARDFRFIHLDEEGAIFRGDADDWKAELKRRFDPSKLAREDYLCTWGDFQRDFYQTFEGANKEHICTTGHPRFDMYKPKLRAYFQPEAERLKERYGDFILINSNLHRVNHHEGLKRVFSERLGYFPEDEARRTTFMERWQHLTNVHASFVHLINTLSTQFPQMNVVVRPHPSENAEFYDIAFGSVKNVHVSREGSVGPWLFACKTMIHDGCTTGLEAYLAEVPVINYKKIEDAAHDSFLPNLFGARCHSEEEVIAQIEKNVAGARNQEVPLPPDALALIDNFQHDSFAKLLGIINDIRAEMPREKSSGSIGAFNKKEALRSVGATLKAGLRRRKSGGLARSKFYGFHDIALDEKMQMAQQVLSTQVRYTLHSNDLFSVDAA